MIKPTLALILLSTLAASHLSCAVESVDQINSTNNAIELLELKEQCVQLRKNIRDDQMLTTVAATGTGFLTWVITTLYRTRLERMENDKLSCTQATLEAAPYIITGGGMLILGGMSAAALLRLGFNYYALLRCQRKLRELCRQGKR
jgi:hypothetical protein